MKNYYKILGLQKNAAKEEIKKAFRSKLQQWKESEKQFKEASEAY